MGAFQDAVLLFARPSRIRTDYGGENVQVGRHMESVRGENHHAWLRGSSVHNQRIERLWRDMRHGFTQFWRDFFANLERQRILDVLNDSNLTALHHVFLPVMNRMLDEFVATWNHHKLRTKGQRTPYQLYVGGMLERYGSQYTAIREVLNTTVIDPNTFGVESVDRTGEEDEEVVAGEHLSGIDNEVNSPADLRLRFPVNSSQQPHNCVDLFVRVRDYLRNPSSST